MLDSASIVPNSPQQQQQQQQRLHSQIHDVSGASHMLFLLVEHDVADVAGPFEVNQEVVDVGWRRCRW
jgi:hypothetical protein